MCNIPQCLLRAVGNGLLRDVQVERHLYTGKNLIIYSERARERELTLNMEQLDWDLS